MKFRCDHVHLRSRDAGAAASFYVAMFGARETGRVGGDPVQRVILDLGGLTVFIEQAAAEVHPAASTPCLGVEHIGLAVEDIEAALAELSGRGVKVRVGITDRGAGVRIAFLEGPDGALIEILERRAA
ncbi:VOC family protein [Methylobacterium sp. J-076]|uniref:VOC family protein n=1 Tax=Methylobacterium sp. J-076 TaxID=2836655 RepID=UPI001FB909F0|nr:VOC family protein [Methylobacterium sp. J-076]MCJ2011079.1 VOC family protein [Methylobacterium sp. J-076]